MWEEGSEREEQRRKEAVWGAQNEMPHVYCSFYTFLNKCINGYIHWNEKIQNK